MTTARLSPGHTDGEKEVRWFLRTESAELHPFGQLCHMDWMERGKRAEEHTLAARALVLTDELTGMLGVFPSRTKKMEFVLDCIHKFDLTPPTILRWWSDRAAEFLGAARLVRQQRPLAHFVSVPWRHAARAERSNRTVEECTRAALAQCGAPSTWWPLAAPFWAAQFNGHMVGKSGHTPYFLMHGEDAGYKLYPFGALVMARIKQRVDAAGKFESRLVATILVEITLGPAGVWGSCYGVFILDSIISRGRASSICMCRTSDVIFPEEVSFPLKQRLMIHGVVRDRTLPTPKIRDDDDEWCIQDVNLEDEVNGTLCDGYWEENADVFDDADNTQRSIMLDPDVADVPAAETPIVGDPDFHAVDADRAELDRGLERLRDEVCARSPAAAPAGWRIDSFERSTGPPRLVSVPPWSRRPPDVLPEDWLTVSRRDQIILQGGLAKA